MKWFAIVLVLTVAALILTRAWERLENGDALVVTEGDLAVVRQLPVIWAPTESGAPAVFDLTETALPSVTTNDYRSAMRAAEVVMHLGELAPGQYEYESPLPSEDLADQPFVEHHLARVDGRHVVVDVTEAHLKLLRGAITGVIDEGGRRIGVEINPKRPYGDMTFFELDMAAILGITPGGPPRKDYPTLRDFTDEQTRMLDALHEQMQPVLQIFLQRAKLEPGRFIRQPAGYGRWRRVM